MKRIIVVLFSLMSSLALSQNYSIRVGGVNGDEYRVDSIPSVTFNNEIKDIEIKRNSRDSSLKTVALVASFDSRSFINDTIWQTLHFPNDIRDIVLTINDSSSNVLEEGFILHASSIQHNGGQEPVVNSKIKMPAEKTATAYILKIYRNRIINIPGVGLKLTKTNEKYTGNEYIHIFFDQNGNNLLQQIPLGINRANYVVHIIYLAPKNNSIKVNYTVTQSPADIEEGVIIRGDGDLQNTFKLNAKEEGKPVTEYEWRHYSVALTPSSFDIKFDIIRSGLLANEDELTDIDPVVVASKTIKIKKTYHGSVDVGVLSTNLQNPSFALTTSDIDSTQMVVKRSLTGSRIVASAMYSFYLSPIVLLEKLLAPQRVRNYRLEGRNFVDDHKIYERIYPTVGIGLNNRILDNIFLGGKWEFIRGGSIFIGYHWGRVNILNVDENFEFEKTYITKSSFDLKSDTKIKGNICFGMNLDIRIIKNLFQTSAAE